MTRKKSENCYISDSYHNNFSWLYSQILTFYECINIPGLSQEAPLPVLI